MGRMMPEVQHSQTLRDELALAQAVDEAVARVAPLELPDASDGEAAALVEQVVAELDGEAAGAAAAAPPKPHPVRKRSLVFLDAVEVTQEVQDLAHSVPLVARKPTIVRAYLRCGAAVSVRGELRVSRKPHGPWHTIASLGPAQLDPSRSGGSLADLEQG